MQVDTGARLGQAAPARSLFFVEYGLGHKTHLRFLEQHLLGDGRFDATIIPLYWMDRLGDFLGRLNVPLTGGRELDFLTWWVFQFKRQQVGYLLRRYRPKDLDLVYIHTQTAATSVLDLPREIPAVVSIDLTWKLAFQESRYVNSPFLKTTLELERRIYERSDLVVSFSDWAAASVIDDYGIPASKVQVVRNGVTLPQPGQAAAGPGGPGMGAGRTAGRLGRGWTAYRPGRSGNGHGNGNGHHANENGNGHYRNGNGNGNGNGHHANGNGNGNGNGDGHGAGNGNGAGGGLRYDDLLKVGFIGNGFTRKGADLLLRVHQEHFADRAHLTLVCGDAPRGSASLPNVKLMAEVPWHELMTEVLPGFDLFVFPTRFDYSPYAVIEAMTAGVPVIATRVGAIPEMIEDGRSGFLIDAGREAPLVERMGWALDNRGELPAMGARARERAEDHYAARTNYPQLLDLLAGVARSGRVEAAGAAW
ncbi:MAG: glycosyltransferase family 4 protein [Chloroflexota bacterium]